MAGEYAIECDGLTKRFGNFTAVSSLKLRIRKGELFGFLGPNGAGKTTTIKMLTTLLIPNEGTARVAGFDLKEEAAFVRSRIGVVPQEFALFGELTAMENLWYIGSLFSMEKEKMRRRSEELLKTVGLFDKRNVLAEGYSGGMKQRLSVAAGLLHTPDILFMDEPTSGLDPQSRIALRELTQSLNDSGITIVYTTHDMEEADKLCHRIAVMDLGKLIAEGTPAELKRMHGGCHRIELELGGQPDRKLLRELKDVAKADDVFAKGNKVEILLKSVRGDAVHRVSSLLSKKGVDVRDLKATEPSLEEVFINLTKKNLKAGL
jgi:ABC-2 type transport system ATP-binding protein